MLATVAILTVLGQQLDSPARYVVQGIAYGGGWMIALWQQLRLMAPRRRFSADYDRLDALVRERIASQEAAWHAGRAPESELVAAFDFAIDAYARLRPDDARWRRIIVERQTLLRAWRDASADPQWVRRNRGARQARGRPRGASFA